MLIKVIRVRYLVGHIQIKSLIQYRGTQTTEIDTIDMLFGILLCFWDKINFICFGCFEELSIHKKHHTKTAEIAIVL